MSAKTVRFAGEAARGPDWVDVGDFLKGLHDLHGITAHFELRTGPGHYVGAVQVTLVATAPHLTSPGRCWSAVLSEAFPGHKHKTLESVAYYLCHKLDSMAARDLWHQESMF